MVMEVRGLQTVAKLFCQKDIKTGYFYWKLVFWHHNNTKKGTAILKLIYNQKRNLITDSTYNGSMEAIHIFSRSLIHSPKNGQTWKQYKIFCVHT